MNVCSCVVGEVLHITCIQCVIIQTLRYCAYCMYTVHSTHIVHITSRSMAIVVDPQLKLIMFLFLSCSILCNQCSLSS